MSPYSHSACSILLIPLPLPLLISNLSLQSQNLTQLTNSTLDAFYGMSSPFSHNLSSLVEKVLALNASLSLNMPSSQEQLLVFLGAR